MKNLEQSKEEQINKMKMDYSKLPHSSEYYRTHPYPLEEEQGGNIYGLYEDHVEWEEIRKQIKNETDKL